jgi:hypothetical protein
MSMPTCPNTARADDLVHPGHRSRSVRQRRYRLSAADGDNAVDAGDRRRGENQRIRIGADHHQFGHAGDLGRNRVHQHRRRIGRLAAGNVEADAFERRHVLSEHGPVRLLVAPGTRELALVEAADSRGGLAQRLRLRPGQRMQCRLERFFPDLQFRHRRRLHPVEAAAVLQNRGVAARTHVGDDRAHRALYLGILRRLIARQCAEGGVEPRPACG